jgi:hypothetical protein
MTNQTEQEVIVTPQVIVTRAGQEDWIRPFVEIAEDTNHDPSSISDPDMIALVARYMDISVDELETLVLGDARGELKVGRPQTGHINIRPATVLGVFPLFTFQTFDLSGFEQSCDIVAACDLPGEMQDVLARPRIAMVVLPRMTGTLVAIKSKE